MFCGRNQRLPWLTPRSGIKSKGRKLVWRTVGSKYTLLFWICSYLHFCLSSSFQKIVSDSLQPHGLKHTRLPCPSLTPRVCSDSCALSQWCHPTISSSVVPFTFCLQSFPASGSYPMSQLFASGSQTLGVSASALVLPMNIQGWFPLGLTSLILISKGLSRVFSSSTVWKHQFFSAQPS